jgi:hypothetical protein
MREITRLNCRQAQRVGVDLNPTPKRAASGSMRSAWRALLRRAPMIPGAWRER